MTNPTRALAQRLRADPTITQAHAAAAAIDALLDAIEVGGMVQPRPAPVMDLGPLRAVRDFNVNRAAVADGQNDIRAAAMYREFARQLNIYFPQDDQA